MARLCMLGTGLIGMFYTMALHGHRRRDRVVLVYSRSFERAQKFADEWSLPHHTTDLDEAVSRPDVDAVVIALPNHRHEEAVAAAARAGVINLTTTLAAEWGPQRLTVNAVAPGTIRTSALAQYDPVAIEAGVEGLPIGRIGEPVEVAQAVAFLASTAGDDITGTVVFVDGGRQLARRISRKE